MEILGRISSFESLGLVDGPGIRYVVFLQGCQNRCKYCHNPETWSLKNSGITISPKELVDRVERFRPYFGEKGGVTFSGGEPLLQPKFLLECLKLCKERGINTVIDTSGVGIGYGEELSEVISLADLIILDIKECDEKKFNELVGQSMKRLIDFIQEAEKLGKKLWLRQVIVPNMNDKVEDIKRLADFIKDIKNVEKVQLLPYKGLGESKYKLLGMPYRLEGTPDMDEEKCKKLEKKLHQLIKK